MICKAFFYYHKSARVFISVMLLNRLDEKSFTCFSDIKLVLISEISVQTESACGFKVLWQNKSIMWFGKAKSPGFI